jgi:hypothetical protein
MRKKHLPVQGRRITETLEPGFEVVEKASNQG